MMPRTSPSLKRRRSWLEIGIAGCSLLASPAEAAWLPFGAVWRSFTHNSVQEHYHRAKVLLAQHGNHHGTPAPPMPSLRGSADASTYQPSRPRRRRRRQQQQPLDHVGSTPTLKSLPEEVAPPLPSGGDRALKVEIAVHGRHGEWEACSPETCTQTRLVFCETLESRIIVANDLCGEELPDAERPCTGEDFATAVCAKTPTAEVSGAAGDGRQGRDGTVADAGGEEVVDTGGGKRGATPPSPSAAVDKKPQNSAPARSWSARGSQGAKVPATPPSDTAVAVEEATPESAGKGDTGEGAERNGPPAAAAAAAKSTGSASATAEPHEDGRSAEEEARGVQQGNESSGKSSPKQNEAESEPSAGKTHREEPAQPVLARIGGTSSKSSRAEYRFWLVLAIGAGAVGSFMAVVVFAVGQYRKEQHRLRGIMALNEFPQDNYINPFARQMSSDLQLSEDDRSAFKL